jgi:DNA polymerase/3'-5' exonuclease PolX
MWMWQKELSAVPGIGAKINLLQSGRYPGIAHKINTVADLTEQDLLHLPKESMLAIKYLDGAPYTRQEIEQLAPIISAQLLPGCDWQFAGSHRRGKPTLNDADVLAFNCARATIKETSTIKVAKFGQYKARLLIKADQRFVPADIVFCTDNPATLMHYTGSKEFNIRMSKLAITKGLKLNEYGLWRANKKLPAKTEADIFRHLGLEYLPPEQR